jgi:hypothetical protein
MTSDMNTVEGSGWFSGVELMASPTSAFSLLLRDAGIGNTVCCAASNIRARRIVLCGTLGFVKNDLTLLLRLHRSAR